MKREERRSREGIVGFEIGVRRGRGAGMFEMKDVNDK